MSLRRLALAALALVAFPSLALACTCAIRGVTAPSLGTPPGTRPVPPGPLGDWEGRDAILVGTVLEIEPPEPMSRPRLVRVLTESSWRDALPDTLTVVVDEAPCAYFSVGGRFLIAADRDTADARRLASRRCAMSYPVGSPAFERLTLLLGPPAWTAPPVGQRAIDAGVVALGTPRPPKPTPTSVVFVPPMDESVSRFEIADFSGAGSIHGGPVLHLEPGLYRIRVTWTDGHVAESYVSVRCEIRYPDGMCQVIRLLRALR